MASQEDCYFFFNSTCTKGDDCAFRHERGALGNPVVCEQWKNGACERNPCHLRHGNLEVQVPTIQTPSCSVPCYYENQPSGCLNFNCNFFHQKPRPFRADYQFNNPVQPRNPRPPMAHPRLNTPFPQRFAHPHMQQFRGPLRHPMEFSLRKMENMVHQQRFTLTGVRPVIFPNHPREQVLGPNLAVPPMFQEGKMGSVNGTLGSEKRFEPRIRGGTLESEKPFEPRIQGGTLASEKPFEPRIRGGTLGSEKPFEPRIRGGTLASEKPFEPRIRGGTLASEKPFEPRIRGGVMTMAVSRAPMNSNLPQAMASDVRMMVNPNHNATRNDGPGLLGEPPLIPFPFGGLFPFNIPQAIVQNIKHQNTKPDRSSESRRSAKRTVKKIDKRHGKSDKNLKHRGERRTSQDGDLDDMKRKKKERKNNSKDVKGTTKKYRKVKKDSAFLTKSKTEERKVDYVWEAKEEGEDLKEIDKGVGEETNLAFKVKTLEEILRDKALKKLRERQEMMEATGSRETNAGTGITPVERVGSSAEAGGGFTNINKISDKTDDVPSQLKPRRIPPLRTKEKSKPLENDKNFGLENREKGLSSGGNTVAVGKSDESTIKDIASNLSAVKVKTLDEIRRAKLKKLEQPKTSSSPELKTMESETTKPRHRKLKPLKPLKNTSRGRKPGTNVGDKRCISAGSGTSSNVTSEEDQKKPFPAITRIKNVLESIPRAKTLSERLFKRKREAQTGLEQTVTPSKVKRLASGLKSRFVGSVSQKTSRKVVCGDVSSSVKATEVSPFLESKEEKVMECSNVESRLTRSDQEARRTNDAVQSAISISSSKKETKSLYEASKTIKTDEGHKKLARATWKPMKKIKLKRLGLLKSETGNDDGGKTRILQNSLGRRIKVNQMKPATVNNDVLQTPISESAKQGGPELNTTVNIFHENSVKAVQSVTMEDDQISSNTTDVTSTTVNHENEPYDSATSKDVKSYVLGNIQSNSSLVNRSDEVSKLSYIRATAMVSKKDEDFSKAIEERLITEETSRKSTLDKLVKEVSDDIKDEEEDLLDEALERAIAELSPMPSDDDEELSNADDLLLEIEEMINF